MDIDERRCECNKLRLQFDDLDQEILRAQGRHIFCTEFKKHLLNGWYYSSSKEYFSTQLELHAVANGLTT